MATVAVTHFSDRLAEAVERKRSQLVVGLDPVRRAAARARSTAISSHFCRGIVDAVAPYAVAVKPQSAFFEAHGADGVRAFARRLRLRTRCRPARHRRREARRHRLDRARVRAGVHPARRRRHGQSVSRRRLASSRSSTRAGATAPGSSASSRRRIRAAPTCRTSTLADGRPLWQHVAGSCAEWGEDLVGERGLSAVGAVVGATFPREVAEARALLPQSVLLLPGIGAQGGAPADVARGVRERPGRRARLRLALGHLRLEGERRRLALGRGRARPSGSRARSGVPRARNAEARPSARYVAPAALPARRHDRRSPDPLGARQRDRRHDDARGGR